VVAIASLANGAMVAGGLFSSAGGIAARSVALWNGEFWEPLGSGISDCAGNPRYVWALAALPGGNLMAGGSFGCAGGRHVNNLARWDGSTWWPIDNGPWEPGQYVLALHTIPDGSLLVGGWLPPLRNLARWDGATLSTFAGGTDNDVFALTVWGNEVIAAGHFVQAGGVPVRNLARWDGVQWTGFGEGTGGGVWPGTVLSVEALPGGAIAAGGRFTTAGGLTSAYWARWAPCYPDCECSAPPGLNVLDFMCFMRRFAAGDPYANCDASTAPPVLNAADFVCFQERFAAGCP
jgi:hypothetical protein